MTTLVGVIIATVVIAAMIALRIIAYESALKERLKASRSGNCDAAPCFGGCNSKRSNPHAS